MNIYWLARVTNTGFHLEKVVRLATGRIGRTRSTLFSRRVVSYVNLLCSRKLWLITRRHTKPFHYSPRCGEHRRVIQIRSRTVVSLTTNKCSSVALVFLDPGLLPWRWGIMRWQQAIGELGTVVMRNHSVRLLAVRYVQYDAAEKLCVIQCELTVHSSDQLVESKRCVC